MAQGQCASLLVASGWRPATTVSWRVQGSASIRCVSRRRRAAFSLASRSGIFLEEYPTDPPSFVLNGGIFSLWGVYDVWRATGDDSAGALFAEALETLSDHVGRWDTGFWSRYDLYPHPIVNVASLSYHTLHIDQLDALSGLVPSASLEAAAARFRVYEASRIRRAWALAHKSRSASSFERG